MSKKKRLGRGLEALLGVGSKTEKEENRPDEKETVSEPKAEFQLGQTGVEVGSIAELKSQQEKTGQASVEEPDEPTILKFADATKPTVGQSVTEQTNSEQNASTQHSVGKTSPQRKPSEQPELNKAASPVMNQDATSEVEDVRLLAQKDKSWRKSASTSSNEVPAPIVELNVYDVDDNPFQPRREFNKSEIESLAESLKTHEQLQPILVRKVGQRYQLISGERRLRAAIHAGWSKIRAQIREADDRLVAELAIVENLQRKDLNPVEKALSFRRYIDEHRCSQEDLAGRLKIDRSTVANLLRLLELPEVVQKAIQVGVISNGHARALLPLGEEHLQIEFCNRIQREGLSVRAIEQLVRDRIDEEDGVKRKPAGKGRTKNNQILSLESELRHALGTKTEIKPSSRGRGKIVIHYTSREEFDRLRALFTDTDGQSNRDAA